MVEAVVLAGADAAGLALAREFARAGHRVVLVETDCHDAERLRSVLARSGDGFPVDLPEEVDEAGILIFGAGFPDAAREALLTCVSPRVSARLGAAARSGETELHLHATAGRSVLAELAGPGAGPLTTAISGLGMEVLHTHGVGPALRDSWMDRTDSLLASGTAPWEIDEAAKALGFTAGPYEQEDVIGLDLRHARRVARGGVFGGIAQHAAAEGRLGRKAGVGWYRYPGGGGAVIDPLVEDLIRHEAHFAGIAPRPLSEDMLKERLLLGLIDAAAHALTQGRAERPEDVDRVAVAALGFPEALGGPLAHAVVLGPEALTARFAALDSEEPGAWPLPAAIPPPDAGAVHG